MTINTPESAGTVVVIEGFCSSELNPFGPVHEYVFPPEEMKEIDNPAQMGPLFDAVAITWSIVKSVPLLVPVVEGVLAITRIRYPVPDGVPAGIVAVTVPEVAVDVNVPIFTGAAKLPEALLS